MNTTHWHYRLSVIYNPAMYSYHLPVPLVIRLADEPGFRLRQSAAEYVTRHRNTTGAERGNTDEQGFGALAEIVVRNRLNMPDINPTEHPLGYDILLPSGVRVDVKCRGGSRPFQEAYESSDGVQREAKHNFFARQLYDERLDADVYLMTHLETPSDRKLPGTTRQRKWILYVCGWVSKQRVRSEGVYLPRGSLTEQGKTWFTYRGQEVEFYHRNLNGLASITDLLAIEPENVAEDGKRPRSLNLTSADAARILYDLVGRGIISDARADLIKRSETFPGTVKPILHANQYFHLLRWLEERGEIGSEELQRARVMLTEEHFEGI